jgi:hypothetical protein
VLDDSEVPGRPVDPHPDRNVVLGSFLLHVAPMVLPVSQHSAIL